MKHAEEIMEILEAFDLTRSFRSAAELAGCDPQSKGGSEATRRTGSWPSAARWPSFWAGIPWS